MGFSSPTSPHSLTNDILRLPIATAYDTSSTYRPHIGWLVGCGITAVIGWIVIVGLLAGLSSKGEEQGTGHLAPDFSYFLSSVSRLAYWIRGWGVLCVCFREL